MSPDDALKVEIAELESHFSTALTALEDQATAATSDIRAARAIISEIATIARGLPYQEKSA
jgi:hypothetical protein